jgi:hypothetical protein
VTENPDWFEHAWEVREEAVYPRLFGPHDPAIYTLPGELFVETFKRDFDPRWLTYGVIETPPSPTRPSWLYVSSGLSNAWEDDAPNPDGPSGLGMEFVLETPQQATWAILRLQHVVAFQILIACGAYPDRPLMSLHDRIPLRSPISDEPCDLTWLTIVPPSGYSPSFTLPTGRVDLLAIVGITEAEAAYARREGGESLLEVLHAGGAYPVTDPTRASLVAV